MKQDVGIRCTKKLLCILFIVMSLTASVLAVTLVRTTTRNMVKTQITILNFTVIDPLPGSAGHQDEYDVYMTPEYRRPISYYGDTLQTDSEYNDWTGIFYVYPPAIPAGSSNSIEYNLTFPWTYCKPFSEATWNGNDDANELDLSFKLIRHFSYKKSSYNFYYFVDNEQFGAEMTFPIGGGFIGQMTLHFYIYEIS